VLESQAGQTFLYFLQKAAMAGSKPTLFFYIFLLKVAAGPFTTSFGFKTGSDILYHSQLLKPT
jgi:hypothetical protein